MTPKAFAILCKGCWFEREQNWIKGPKEYQIDPILVDEMYYNPVKNILHFFETRKTYYMIIRVEIYLISKHVKLLSCD